MDLFNLVAKITLDSSEYSKQIGEAENKAKSFGGKLKSGIGTAAKVGGAAVAAVGAASVALTKKMVDGAAETAAYGDHIDKMSQKMGISAEAYQEWDAIMQHSGTTIDALKPSMKTLASQAEKNSDAFQKLGISQEEVKNLSQEDLFAKVITGLQGMEEGSERTYLTSQLLGRGATELGALLNTSAEDTEKMRQKVHDLGGVMSDESVKAAAAYQDSLQDMQTAFSGLKRNMMGEFMPSLTTVMDGIQDLFTTGGTDKIVKGIGSFVDKIGEVVPKILDVGGKIIVALADGIINNLDPLLGSAFKIIEELTTSLLAGENIKKIMGSAVNVIKELVVFLSQNVGLLIDSAFDIIEALLDGLTDPNTLHELVKASIDMIGEIATGLIDNLPDLIDAAVELAGALANELIHYDWWGLAKKIFASLKDSFKRLFKGDEDEPETPQTPAPKPHGRHASGLKYVPFDEYHAVLHRGERVLTAKESEEYKYKDASPVIAVENNTESVKVMQQMLEELRATRQDMYTIILSALRTNSEGFSVSERDMARLVKKYAFT